jgi:transcriptional regulator with XRE-family HTH domain
MAAQTDLKERFGILVAANRRRKDWTQADLARASELSDDMIARVEKASVGVSFATIEKLAKALEIDPSELFSPTANKNRQRKEVLDVVSRISGLRDDELAWLADVIRVALRRP